MKRIQVSACWYSPAVIFGASGAGLFLASCLVLQDIFRGQHDIELVVVAVLGFIAAVSLGAVYLASVTQTLVFDGTRVLSRSLFGGERVVAIERISDVSLHCVISWGAQRRSVSWWLCFWNSGVPVKESEGTSSLLKRMWGETPKPAPPGAELLLQIPLDSFWDEQIGIFVAALRSAASRIRVDGGVQSRFLGGLASGSPN